MRPKTLTLIVLAAALLLPTLAAAECPVIEIDFTVNSDGTLPGVTRVWLGNMVPPGNPSSCNPAYCTICPPDHCIHGGCQGAGPMWEWRYNGSNCNAFAIEFNFEQAHLGVGTAIGIVNIDPTKMMNGSRPEVHVVLSDCARGVGNCLLRVNPDESSQGPGISYGICAGTEDCAIEPSCRFAQ